MNDLDFLSYSAQTPMVELRRRFHRGETLEQPVPDVISPREALEDVAYVKFVLRQAYSGYSYYPQSRFDRAFEALEGELSARTGPVEVSALMDLLGRQLSFLTDGHLSLTSPQHGVGFYRKWQTYVTDLRLTEQGGDYYDTATGRKVVFGNTLQLFPTLEGCFLLGCRSQDVLTDVELTLDGKKQRLPVHKIQSRPQGEPVSMEVKYQGEIAWVVSSSFVGDDPEALAKCREIGRRCRDYPHVIWDLSNNLGGNSAFAREFLEGLNGVRPSMGRVLSLGSTLVHAKEFGKIKEVPYGFEEEQEESAPAPGQFAGTLHVIINDRVASSGESGVFMALSLPRVVLYGCNTLGIGRFGDLCIYTLPHARVTLWCPQKVFVQAPRETEGYEPQIWLDSSDPAAEVLRHIKHL